MSPLVNHYSHWLRLHHAPKLSAKMALHCIQQLGDAQSVCGASLADLYALGLSQTSAQFIRSPDYTRIENDLSWLHNPNCHLICYADTAYPVTLKQISSPPLLLFAEGDISLLGDPQLAIVGARYPSPTGVHHAKYFSTELSRAGLLITSGLAAGIDTAAHEGALSTNMPTIAVIGTGMDIIYPVRNRRLTERIKEAGLIISEFSCGTPAYAKNFPQRNRLISGLVLGVLVVEAAKRSGSLITAKYAMEQGREVFAIPGSIHNPTKRGCHSLIQNGAKLVQTTADILQELVSIIDIPELEQATSTPSKSTIKSELPKLDHQQQQLLNQMEFDAPTTVDMLAQHCQMPAAEISSLLLMLELNGYVASENHAYIRLF